MVDFKTRQIRPLLYHGPHWRVTSDGDLVSELISYEIYPSVGFEAALQALRNGDSFIVHHTVVMR